MQANSPAQVLVAPLDWGLGHATRCIPIIKALISEGATVIIAASGLQKALLQKEFPGLEFLDIPGYGIRYAAGGMGLVWQLIFRIPAIMKSIRRENTWLKDLCSQRKIDAIISDNRYGLYHKSKYSVFITHQLFIQSGLGNFANRILMKWNYGFIRKFSACWVPDLEGEHSIAGILSNPPRLPDIPVKYIGILSRFSISEKKGNSNPLLVLISGPEPQRTSFESLMLSELAGFKGKAVVVRGLPRTTERKEISNEQVGIINHLPADQLNDLLNNSELIICRSGYSTVMDLIRLRKRAILVPTPGQPEQEYLGQRLHEKKWMLTISQQEFNLVQAVKLFQEGKYQFPPVTDSGLSQQFICGFLRQINIQQP